MVSAVTVVKGLVKGGLACFGGFKQAWLGFVEEVITAMELAWVASLYMIFIL